MKKILSTLFVFAVFSTSAYGIIHKRDIQDWLKLRNFAPTSEISKIARDSKFTSLGEKLFYVHDPGLLTKDEFYGKCRNDEKASVLGCYYSHTKIYILQVSEKKLDGIVEVTSSHEMLHAAYDRLKDDEKNNINALLYDVYLNLPDSQAKKDISTYDTNDRNLLYNELHSIVGTEVVDIPNELEKYYSRYFYDRATVVGYAEGYDNEFKKLQDQISEIDTRLEALKSDLDTSEYDLNLLYTAIESQKIVLDKLSDDPKAYNSEVPSYNSKVVEYRKLAKDYNQKVSEYNKLIEVRGSIAVENNNLFDAIDTRLPEVTQ